MSLDTRPSNPFRSATTRPGRLPYQTTSGDLRQLLTACCHALAQQRQSAIIGPHGSGKSTLLAHLLPALREGKLTAWAPKDIQRLTWHVGQTPTEFPHTLEQLSPGGLLVIDGFEQCGWLQKLTIMKRCKQTQSHLLVTAHRPLRRFYTLLTTAADRAAAFDLFKILLQETPQYASAMEDRFTQRWQQSEGNFRQLWSMLYDDFEKLVQTSKASE